MSGQAIFDLAFSVVIATLGGLNLRRAYRGVWPKPEFITLGRNPSPPEAMTPRMQKVGKAGGFILVGFGVASFALTIIRLYSRK